VVEQNKATIRHEIDGLYEAFRTYPGRSVMPANCTCCEPFADEALSSKPLSTLSSADLLDYFFLAINNVGDENDFRHFLPRILELFVVEEKPHFAWQTLIHNLRAAECWRWPKSERNAMEAFFRGLESSTRHRKLARGGLAILQEDRGDKSAHA
jgi:hypothetical protein